MYKLAIFLMTIFFFDCCTFNQKDSKNVRNIKESPLNKVKGVVNVGIGTKINTEIPINIVNSIIDSINYQDIKDSTFDVTSISHYKISDKYTFFDISVSFLQNYSKDIVNEHLVGVYYDNKNIAIMNNLSKDPCSELHYYSPIIEDGTIFFKIIDFYSCDDYDIEYFEYLYKLENKGIQLKKREITKPPEK